MQRSKILSALLSVAIAFGLWFYVITVAMIFRATARVAPTRLKRQRRFKLQFIAQVLAMPSTLSTTPVI